MAHDTPVPWSRSRSPVFSSGGEWLTRELLAGLVRHPSVAGRARCSCRSSRCVIAVPLSVAAAIYCQRNRRTAGAEFHQAGHRVHLGDSLGRARLFRHRRARLRLLRTLSQVAWLSWVPGFPMSERLNALTAGCLLALMAVPTIFSLAEDALNNVPRHFKEAILRARREPVADHRRASSCRRRFPASSPPCCSGSGA